MKGDVLVYFSFRWVILCRIGSFVQCKLEHDSQYDFHIEQGSFCQVRSRSDNLNWDKRRSYQVSISVEARALQIDSSSWVFLTL